MYSYYIIAILQPEDAPTISARALEGALEVGMEGSPPDLGMLVKDLKVTGPYPAYPSAHRTF